MVFSTLGVWVRGLSLEYEFEFNPNFSPNPLSLMDEHQSYYWRVTEWSTFSSPQCKDSINRDYPTRAGPKTNFQFPPLSTDCYSLKSFVWIRRNEFTLNNYPTCEISPILITPSPTAQHLLTSPPRLVCNFIPSWCLYLWRSSSISSRFSTKVVQLGWWSSNITIRMCSIRYR